MTASHSATIRPLGAVGILGGLGLLASFVINIPAAANTVRLVLSCTGAIAVGVALFGPHAAVSRRLALAAVAPLIVANVLYIAWILLAVGRERPFAGEFGIVGFWAGVAFWLADAWFGMVAFRLRVVWRSAALALAIGALMAITGMDRLELTSQANPTVFANVGITGVALVGVAWILLGLEVLPASRRAPSGRAEAPTGA